MLEERNKGTFDQGQKFIKLRKEDFDALATEIARRLKPEIEKGIKAASQNILSLSATQQAAYNKIFGKKNTEEEPASAAAYYFRNPPNIIQKENDSTRRAISANGKGQRK